MEISSNQEKEVLISKLIKLRDEFSEEIPEKIIHSSDPDNKFKVRGNWFQGVVSTAEHAKDFVVNKEKFSKELTEIEELISFFTASEEFSAKLGRPGARTDATDIAKGNRLIELSLSLLES